MPATRLLATRFWEKVKKSDDCWVWTAAIDKCGYGYIGLGPGKGMGKAHRVSWQLHKGGIPEGLCVLHKCDNPSCVNPEHLFLGTQKDNAVDRELKGRGNQPVGDKHWTHKHPERLKRGDAHWTRHQPSPFRGSNNPKAKLSQEQVDSILRIHALGGMNYLDLAHIFNVHASTIGRIVRKEIW